jgi:hypothetical protein
MAGMNDAPENPDEEIVNQIRKRLLETGDWDR